MNTTLTLVWEEPQGSNSELVVDYYRLAIVPRPLSHPDNASITVSVLHINVTLVHNTPYTINITAVNCAGESGTYEYTTIIGKHY